jgi:hypothetical protein
LFILGPTGTGKSTFIIGLLRQLLADHLPFMVFDFKRNYRCLLADDHGADVVVLSVGRDTAPLALNALSPPGDVRFEEWAEVLSDIISTSYLLMQGARNVLKEALLRAKREQGDRATLRHAHAVLDLELRSSRAGSRRYGWLESSTRALEELSKGGFGTALGTTGGVGIAELLSRPVVFELEGLGADQRSFFCLLMLQGVLLLRKQGHDVRESLRHALVFDESHNVFPKERPGELGVPSRLAREVREYGEAIIAATQQTDVSESLIANTGIKIVFRTDFPRDVSFAAALMQVDARFLPRLALGIGLCRLPVRHYSAFVFAFREQPLKNVPVSDDDLHARFLAAGLPAGEPTQAEECAPSVSEREEALLRDVAATPISPITHRYQRLGWHMETGNRTKDAIIGKGFARFDAVSTPRGQVKILTLTAAGLDVLAAHGVVPRATRSGGPEHEYWKHEVRSHLERHGFAVVDEHPLGGGKTADLRAEKNGRVIFIEVETGRSDIPANLAKYSANDELVVFFTSETVAERHREEVESERPGTRSVTPRELDAIAS